MKTLALIAASILAVLSLSSCGLSPAAGAGSQGGSYSSGPNSGGAPFLGGT